MIDLLISGGQTGADQGGLFAANAVGIPTGGWAPKGWKTDAGPAPWLADYGLKECPFIGYRIRTIANVRQATALVWFGNPKSPGGLLTLGRAAAKRLVPLVLEWPTVNEDWADLVHARFLREWLPLCDCTCLMVAGNRERTNPGIGAYVERVLTGALQSEATHPASQPSA